MTASARGARRHAFGGSGQEFSSGDHREALIACNTASREVDVIPVSELACERCGRPAGEGRTLCARCESEVALKAATAPRVSRVSSARISLSCSCGTYAGVKVHALGCPEADRDAIAPSAGEDRATP